MVLEELDYLLSEGLSLVHTYNTKVFEKKFKKLNDEKKKSLRSICKVPCVRWKNLLIAPKTKNYLLTKLEKGHLNFAIVLNQNTVVVDVDNKKGKKGDESLDKLLKYLNVSRETFLPSVKTPHGHHYYLRIKDGYDANIQKIIVDNEHLNGIEFLSHGHICTSPFSILPAHYLDDDSDRFKYELIDGKINFIDIGDDSNLYNLIKKKEDFETDDFQKKVRENNHDQEKMSVSMDDIILWLSEIDNTSYDIWWRTATAIKDRFDNAVGFEIFNEWSKRDYDDYDYKATLDQWESVSSYTDNQVKGINVFWLHKLYNDSVSNDLDKKRGFFDNHRAMIDGNIINICLTENNIYTNNAMRLDPEIRSILPSKANPYTELCSYHGYKVYGTIYDVENYDKLIVSKNEGYDSTQLLYYQNVACVMGMPKSRDTISDRGFDALNMIDKVFDCLSNGSNIEKNLIYDYITHVVRYPHIKISWVLMVNGIQGIGKSLITHIIKTCLGDHCLILTPDVWSENFTGVFKNHSFYAFEELLAHNNSTNFNKIKNLIKSLLINTEYRIVTAKYKEPSKQKNNFNMCITCNIDDDKFALNDDDRKLCVIMPDCKKLDDSYDYLDVTNKDEFIEFFTKLYGMLKEQSVKESLVNYFRISREITDDFNVALPPDTVGKKEMKATSKDSFFAYYDELLSIINDGGTLFNSEFIHPAAIINEIKHMVDCEFWDVDLRKLKDKKIATILEHLGYKKIDKRYRLTGFCNSSFKHANLNGKERFIFYSKTGEEVLVDEIRQSLSL